VDAGLAGEALDLLEVDALGLDDLDRQILRRLAQTFEGRPVGLGTLADSVGEAPDTIEDVYEPYLLQAGLIVRTPRGRVATARAFRHLGLVPSSSEEQPGLF
jgi:Holliday junction DNA helicase RuvB